MEAQRGKGTVHGHGAERAEPGRASRPARLRGSPPQGPRPAAAPQAASDPAPSPPRPQDLQIISTDESQVLVAVQEWHQTDTYNLYQSGPRGERYTLVLEGVRSSRQAEEDVVIDILEVGVRGELRGRRGAGLRGPPGCGGCRDPRAVGRVGTPRAWGQQGPPGCGGPGPTPALAPPSPLPAPLQAFLQRAKCLVCGTT